MHDRSMKCCTAEFSLHSLLWHSTAAPLNWFPAQRTEAPLTERHCPRFLSRPVHSTPARMNAPLARRPATEATGETGNIRDRCHQLNKYLTVNRINGEYIWLARCNIMSVCAKKIQPFIFRFLVAWQHRPSGTGFLRG